MMEKISRRHVLGALAATGMLLSGTVQAQAQEFPNRPLRLVVSYAAGGGSDAVARQISGHLSASLKQTVIVDNRPGGNFGPALSYVTSQPADGHTILMTDLSQFAIYPHIFKQLPYDPAGYEPVAMLYRFPFVLVVNPNHPAKTLKEFIAASAARSNGIAYASAGTGTPIHFGMEIVRTATGMNGVHVPYKGMAPALNDLMANQVEAAFADIPTAVSFIKSGRLKALAVSSPARQPTLPDVPTFIESGYPQVKLEGWFGIMAKRGTPPAVVQKLNAAVVSAVGDPRINEWIRSVAGTPAPLPNTSQDFARVLQQDSQMWGKVARDLNVSLD